MRVDEKIEKGAARLRVAEIYASRQGGPLTGRPSVFVRLSGCNLRCHFCDTPFASWTPEGPQISLDELLSKVLEFPEADVVITGGEPLIFPALTELTQYLRQAGRVITIETAGTVDTPFVCDLLSISPKLSSSAPDVDSHPAWHRTHHERRERLDLVREWISRFDYQLKFVVGSPSDTAEVLDYLHRLGSASHEKVWLMPEGTDWATLEEKANWLQPFCSEHGFHYCPRQHIQWYGNRRGT
ncbi:MAG: 7-carboxy-7-deazaguanine synthase QueE [Pirellulales bacterium]